MKSSTVAVGMAALLSFALFAASGAASAEYPERPIKVAPRLGERLKQSVVIDNRAGANEHPS